MGVNSFLGKPLAKWVSHKIIRESLDPIKYQNQILKMILTKASITWYGKKYGFDSVSSYDQFKIQVPLLNYEEMRPLIERISLGEKNVMWPGLPLYFAKTSGTTSGVKYIPITKDSMPNHINSARNALLMYIFKTGNSRFTDHKMIFLQGSPVLDKHGNIPTGRLSGIVAHHVPRYLQKNRLPSWETNCINDWEEKVNAIVDETINENMSLISGIPSWLRMYFENLVEKGGKPVGEIFPYLQLLVVGGVNFEPYRPIFNNLIGRSLDTIELFPASEGFFAFQDEFPSDDLLLNINSGIFYEFIPATNSELKSESRIPLEDVKTGIDYALIINSNAGLYAYSIGDLVRFTSIKPYKLKVTGRTAHYISAFGEHVISSEVESALAEVLTTCDARVSEFTVAPIIQTGLNKSRHEWIIEFEKQPDDMDRFVSNLDNALRKRNIYYNDLIAGHVLNPLKVTCVPSGTFNEYMKSKGMLGGQNKVQRLSNNRSLADDLVSRITGFTGIQ